MRDTATIVWDFVFVPVELFPVDANGSSSVAVAIRVDLVELFVGTRGSDGEECEEPGSEGQMKDPSEPPVFVLSGGADGRGCKALDAGLRTSATAALSAIPRSYKLDVGHLMNAPARSPASAKTGTS